VARQRGCAPGLSEEKRPGISVDNPRGYGQVARVTDPVKDHRPPDKPQGGVSLGDAVLRLFMFAGGAFLFFLLGSWVTWQEVFPFRDHLRNAFLGAEAVIRDAQISNSPLSTGLWRKQRRGGNQRGVVRLQRERTFEGLTLILTGQSAHLIDLEGKIRHTWHLDYNKIITPEERRSSLTHESRVYWRPARVFPNGDLLVMVELTRLTPQGLALVRLDRDSRPLWIFHGSVHHDFDIAADGKIYVLGQGLRAAAPAGIRLRGPLIDERLFVLSPAGKLLRDFSLLDAFAGTPYAQLVNAIQGDVRYDKGDYLHSNNLEIADAATAARFDFVSEGQVLLSMRNLRALALLDMQSEKIVWVRRGSWFQQHDPDFLANGNLLLFDNKGDWERGGKSRVLEYDPTTEAIVWQYPGPKGGWLWSAARSEQQRLPNGNTLINENEGGRLLEVTVDGDLAWEYICPFQHDENKRLLCNIMFAARYTPEQVPFPMNEGRVPAP